MVSMASESTWGKIVMDDGSTYVASGGPESAWAKRKERRTETENRVSREVGDLESEKEERRLFWEPSMGIDPIEYKLICRGY